MKSAPKPLLMCAIAMAMSTAAYAGGDKGRMMDTDNDGVVSAAEHASGATAMFTGIDADKNGSVTAAEMDAHWKAKGKRTQKEGELSSADKIKAIDTDGDGALSAAEHSAGSQAKFAEMDANGDGSLDKAEMDAGHKGMKK